MTKSERREKKFESLEKLHRLIKPGDIVYTVLRHVSRSGMSRDIDVFIIVDGSPQRISYDVANACEYRLTDNGLKVSGCGMDMGFDVVYQLGYAMFPNGFRCAGKRTTYSSINGCNASDHSNPGPDRDNYTGEIIHKSGGYAFHQQWM